MSNQFCSKIFQYSFATLIFWLLVQAAPAAVTTRVSLNTAGEEANNDSDVPTISADGRFVAFESRATNLDTIANNGNRHIFVHDRRTKKTSVVSISSNGTQGNGYSYAPSLSANGRYVTFESDSDNLVLGDHNGVSDIFIHDRVTHNTTLVSVSPNGALGDDASYVPSISDDGRYVAFQSLAKNLVANDTNQKRDVFVHDTRTGNTFRVSVSSDGTQANWHSGAPDISANGRVVGFESLSSNLVSGDTNAKTDVFVHEISSKKTFRVSVADNEIQSKGHSYEPSLSADGRYIAFYALSGNLVPSDTNRGFDVFVHDRIRKITRRMSISSTRAQGNNWSEEPSISANGQYVAFYSFASNLVSGDNNRDSDIFLRDRSVAKTSLIDVNSNGKQGNQYSFDPSISANGRYIAYYSSSTNLVPGDTNRKGDIFVYDRQ